jgi:hypothetical protein
MVDRPDPRCLPLEVEMVSLHRTPGLPRRRPRRMAGHGVARLRLRLAILVNGTARRGPV